MTNAEILKQTEAFVKEILEGEGSGHDWYHIDQVRKNALHIAQSEDNCDLFIIELAALLHDIADHKLHDGDYEKGGKVSRAFLEQLQVDKAIIDHVVSIVSSISFSKNAGPMKTKEGEIVQDADRLEAIGAIGIARCFAYGGSKQRIIYDPTGKNKENSLQHFYDKLLKVKDLMNTEGGKQIAKERDAFLRMYLDQFLQEWEGKR